MSREVLLTVIVDAIVSIITIAVGIWVAPEYREFALSIVVALQGIAAALIAYFEGDRKVAELRAEVKRQLR